MTPLWFVAHQVFTAIELSAASITIFNKNEF